MIIRRKYYSPLSLEQREYNVLSELYHSGGKRVYKKYVGKLRRALGNRIQKSVDKASLAHDDSVKNLNNVLYEKSKTYNPKLGKKLIAEGKRNNIRILHKNQFERGTNIDPGPYNYFSNDISGMRKDFKEIHSDFKGDTSIFESSSSGDPTRKAANILFPKDHNKKVDGVINLTTQKLGEDNALLAHELGHYYNTKGKSTKKIINWGDKLYESLDNELKRNDNVSKNPSWKRVGKSILSDLASSIDEWAAWRRGINLMKKNGATPEELKRAKEIRKAGLRSYKAEHKLNRFELLLRKVQIPSRIPE